MHLCMFECVHVCLAVHISQLSSTELHPSLKEHVNRSIHNELIGRNNDGIVGLNDLINGWQINKKFPT